MPGYITIQYSTIQYKQNAPIVQAKKTESEAMPLESVGARLESSYAVLFLGNGIATCHYQQSTGIGTGAGP